MAFATEDDLEQWALDELRALGSCSYPQVSAGGVARRAPSTRSARREKPRHITV
ncbi:hypothetical protein EV658_12730, partial [Phaeovulum veldkampii DSM 11550]